VNEKNDAGKQLTLTPFPFARFFGRDGHFVSFARVISIFALVTTMTFYSHFAYSHEIEKLAQSKTTLERLIDEMLVCDRFKSAALAEEVKIDIKKINGFKKIQTVPTKNEAGDVSGWISVYQVNEIYSRLHVTEIRQIISPELEAADLWIAFEASMPRVKATLKRQLGVEFKDDMGTDAIPGARAGDIAFYEGKDATVDLVFFIAMPGKIYVNCRRNTRQ